MVVGNEIALCGKGNYFESIPTQKIYVILQFIYNPKLKRIFFFNFIMLRHKVTNYKYL